jgi:hypothetical protein
MKLNSPLWKKEAQLPCGRAVLSKGRTVGEWSARGHEEQLMVAEMCMMLDDRTLESMDLP